MADVIFRAPRAGDGDGLARSWLDAGANYATLNPDLFQIRQADGLAQQLEGWLLSITSEHAHALVAEKDGQAAAHWSRADALTSPPAVEGQVVPARQPPARLVPALGPSH